VTALAGDAFEAKDAYVFDMMFSLEKCGCEQSSKMIKTSDNKK